MGFLRVLGTAWVVGSITMFGCGDDSSGAGAEAAGGSPAAGGAGSGGQPAGDGGGGGEPVIGALTHCEPTAFHCIWPSSFDGCTEYSEADAATYEPLCIDGDGAWASGFCDETGVVGACLPNMYCMGMGIFFLENAAQLADAQESCSSTGGTWQEPAP